MRAPQWLGDAVVSTVFLSRLKTRFPDASISVLCSDALVPIFSSHPVVQTTIPYARTDSAFDVAKRIKIHGFETAYILPRSFRTALEARWAGIPRRIGFSGDWRSFLLTRAMSYDSQRAYAHRYLTLIDEESVPLAATPPHFPSQPPASDNGDVADFFAKTKRPILGMGPASVAPSRTWDLEKFAGVANVFFEKTGGSVILFGSPNERAITSRVKERVRGPVLDTAGRLSLPELGWAVKSCNAMFVNDSGLMHVSSCFSVPTTVVFGASDPTWALPLWGAFTAIQHKEIFCVPCLKNRCVRFGDGTNECLKTISVAEVWNALRKNFE